jgi:hypothetical protein
MKTLVLIAVIVGMNVAVGTAETKPVLGNDGGTSRQAVFPDNAQTSRFGMTNQVQHGTSTWSAPGTRSGMSSVQGSITNKPSGVLTNPPGSTVNLPNPPGSSVNLPSGVITNPSGPATNQPSGTNAPNDHPITP